MESDRYRITLRGVAAAAMVLCSAARAQQSSPRAADSEQSLQEVVVTANKLGADLNKAPVTAVALAPEVLERDNILDIHELSLGVPSLTTTKVSDFAVNYIRGVGSTTALGGQESAVATYVDGVYLQRQQGGVLDLVDTSNVTVLKGPQGTLYGRNATGGAILVETANPATDKFEGSFLGDYARFNASRLEGVVNIPITDTLAVRIAGQVRNGGGYFTNINDGSRVGDERENLIRLKVQWQPITDLTLRYALEYFDQLANSYQQRELLNAPECLACAIYPNTPVPGPGQFYVSTMGPGHFNISRYTAQTFTAIYATDGFTLTSISGYRRQRTQLTNDSDNVKPDFAGNTIREEGPTLSNDTYLRTKFNFPLNGLLGVSYLQDRDEQNFFLGGDVFAPLAPHSDDHIRVESYSGYGELTYSFPAGFKLTGGARYNEDVKKAHVVNNADALLGLGIAGLPDAADFSRKATFSSVTPRAVFSYELGGGYYYASYNRGEKSGAYPAPLYSPALGPARPERLDNFEIGAKNTLLDGRAHTTVAAFYGRYRDIQVQILDNQTSSVLLQNAATAKVEGLELGADAALGPIFSVSFGATYLHNVFNSYPNAAVSAPAVAANSFPGVSCPTPASPLGFVGCREDLSGTPLPFAPRWSGFIAPQAQFALPNGWQSALSLNVKSTSRFLFGAGGTGPLHLDQQAGYTLVGGNLTLTTPNGQTQFGVYVDNLFGVRYNDYVSTSTFGTYAVAAPPRTFGVRIRQKF